MNLYFLILKLLFVCIISTASHGSTNALTKSKMKLLIVDKHHCYACFNTLLIENDGNIPYEIYDKNSFPSKLLRDKHLAEKHFLKTGRGGVHSAKLLTYCNEHCTHFFEQTLHPNEYQTIKERKNNSTIIKHLKEHLFEEHVIFTTNNNAHEHSLEIEESTATTLNTAANLICPNYGLFFRSKPNPCLECLKDVIDSSKKITFQMLALNCYNHKEAFDRHYNTHHKDTWIEGYKPFECCNGRRLPALDHLLRKHVDYTEMHADLINAMQTALTNTCTMLFICKACVQTNMDKRKKSISPNMLAKALFIYEHTFTAHSENCINKNRKQISCCSEIKNDATDHEYMEHLLYNHFIKNNLPTIATEITIDNNNSME